MVIKLSQQYNVGEKPTVILYSYINRQTGTPDKNSKNSQVFGVRFEYLVAPFARRHLRCIYAAISVGSQCVVARFARKHLWGICGAVSVGSQCMVARFARGYLWGICAAVSLGSQCVVARFAQKHLTGICAAVSVESQYVLARFARRHLWGICATVSVGSHGTHLSTKMADSVENRVLPAVPIPSTLLEFGRTNTAGKILRQTLLYWYAPVH